MRQRNTRFLTHIASLANESTYDDQRKYFQWPLKQASYFSLEPGASLFKTICMVKLCIFCPDAFVFSYIYITFAAESHKNH